jgi:hypothetical protein
LQIINCLKINHIRILLEVRTPFLLDAQSQIEKSKFYYEQFKSHSDKVFILNTIEHNIATAYIKRTLQLSQHACERLAGILGDNLLDIQSALQVLRGKVPLNEELESMTDAQLDEYWYSCGISTNTIIFSLISKLRTIPILSSIFEVAYLFRGEIPCQALNDIYGEKAADYINEAINSTVFEQAQENLVCKHLRFLWAIKETSNQYEYKKLAKKTFAIYTSTKRV